MFPIPVTEVYNLWSLRVSSNQLFMFCINNNVFSSTPYFDVFINNIVVAKCKSTLGGGLYMYSPQTVALSDLEPSH